MPQPPTTWAGDWYICVPVFNHAIDRTGNYRCTEVLLVQAKSEEEAADKALAGTDETWFGCAVVLATAFKEV